jgi:serine/threonine protein kinase
MASKPRQHATLPVTSTQNTGTVSESVDVGVGVGVSGGGHDSKDNTQLSSQQRTTASMSVDMTTGDLEFLEPTVLKDGYLLKLSRDRKNWRRRWAVLKGDALFFYRRAESGAGHDTNFLGELEVAVPIAGARVLDWDREPVKDAPKWNNSSQCHECKSKFSFFTRRHHCRHCGSSFCHKHSSSSIEIPKFGLLEPVRVCDTCYTTVNAQLKKAKIATQKYRAKTLKGSNGTLAKKRFNLPSRVADRERGYLFALKTADDEVWLEASSKADSASWVSNIRMRQQASPRGFRGSIPTYYGAPLVPVAGAAVGSVSIPKDSDLKHSTADTLSTISDSQTDSSSTHLSTVSSIGSTHSAPHSPALQDDVPRAASRTIHRGLWHDFSPLTVEEWNVEDVTNWLAKIDLPQYQSIFLHNSIDGSMLLGLSDKDLLQACGITNDMHRRKIITKAHARQEAAMASINTPQRGPPHVHGRAADTDEDGDDDDDGDLYDAEVDHDPDAATLVRSPSKQSQQSAASHASSKHRRARTAHGIRIVADNDTDDDDVDVDADVDATLPRPPSSSSSVTPQHVRARTAIQLSTPSPSRDNNRGTWRAIDTRIGAVGQAVKHSKKDSMMSPSSTPSMAEFAFRVGERVAYLDAERGGRAVGIILSKIFTGVAGTDEGKFEVQVMSDGTSRVFSASELLKFRNYQVDFVKGKLIGKGGYGRVFNGLNKTDGRLIAVKEMNLTQSNAKSAKRKYEVQASTDIGELTPEISLMQMLDHPNIVKFLGSHVDEKECKLYIYMEKISGGSLKSLLSNYGPLPEAVVQTYTRQILHGLVYLHDNGIVHRDIKGCNVLITTDGVAKLADFGVSKKVNSDDLKELSRVTKPDKDNEDVDPETAARNKRRHDKIRRHLQGTNLQTMIGSPYWMAPEVVRQAGYGRKADVWSVGCTVIEMASGTNPWHGYNQIAACFMIGESGKIPEIPEHLSPLCQDFLRKCLIRDKNMRPSSHEMLQHDWLNTDLLDQ